MNKIDESELEVVENPEWETIMNAADRLSACKFAGPYISKTRMIKVQYISRTPDSFDALLSKLREFRNDGIRTIIGGFYD